MTQIGKKYVWKEMFRDDAGEEEQEAFANARLQDHHYISSSRNMPVPLFNFVLSSPNDPAKKVCNHVLFHWCLDQQSELARIEFYFQTTRPSLRSYPQP